MSHLPTIIKHCKILLFPAFSSGGRRRRTNTIVAGNRWHIDCFRCNTCGTLLDSDANLLLLGDGSLICNNCTYSCSACNNKIEDLAILTGDQAFCANCFKCRNCKRKIDNLRYARTSQGIFCMSCHESLMARRRKRTKMPRTASANSNSSGAVVLDKSLPALPPHAVPASAFPPESDSSTLAGSVADPIPSPNIRADNPFDAQKGKLCGSFRTVSKADMLHRKHHTTKQHIWRL
jgi:hypothetical protein